MKRAITSRRIIPSNSVITNDEERAAYWKKLMIDWNLDPQTTHFPGCHPVSIEKKNLKFFTKYSSELLVSLKSDGVRHIMYMTTRIGTTDQPVCLLIDRARNMYEIEVWANAPYFQKGTILDGELLWRLPDENTLTFLVFDVIRLKGDLVMKESYSTRLTIVERIIFSGDENDSDEYIEHIIVENDSILCKNSMYNLKLEHKRFAPADKCVTIWNDRDQHAFRNDGLIFCRMTLPYCFGTAKDNTYKWKPGLTIDVMIESQNDIIVNSNESDNKIKIHSIRKIPVRLIKNDLQYTNTDIVECDINVANKIIELFPVRKRYDKHVPNTLKTVESTFNSLIQNVTLEMLSKAL